MFYSKSQAKANKYRLSKDNISFIKEYFYKALKDINPKIRDLLMNKYNSAASANFISWNILFPGDINRLRALGNCDYKKLSDICDSVFTIIKALASNEISTSNLCIRIKLLSGILPITEKQLKRYLVSSISGFLLFNCLYRLIFNELRLHECKKEILLHASGFLDNHKLLSINDIECKLNKARSGLLNKQGSLSSKVTSIIAKFKILLPYLNYDFRFDLTGDLVFISPEICQSIKIYRNRKCGYVFGK